MNDEVGYKYKNKTGGGAGGHNGIRSIDAHCGKDYRRMRLGIGHPGSKEKVTGHVLGDFAKSDQEWLDTLLQSVGKDYDSWRIALIPSIRARSDSS